jgi:hypothetical protein
MGIISLHVLLHNPQGGVESCTFADFLSRKERFKDVTLNLGRHPGTIVGDLDHHGIIVAPGSNSKFAFTAHVTALDPVLSDTLT